MTWSRAHGGRRRAGRGGAPRALSRDPPPGREAVRVTRLERSTEGFSQETFSFDVETRAAARARVRRQARAGRRPARALRPRAGVPRPARALRRSAALAADAVVRARSRRPRPPLLRDGAPRRATCRSRRRAPTAAGRSPTPSARRLGPEVVAALARLHAVDWRAPRSRLPRRTRAPGAARPRASSRAGRRASPRAACRVDAAARRRRSAGSRARARHRRASTLVHGDYRLGNFLVVRDDGGAARSPASSTGRWCTSAIRSRTSRWCTSPLWRAGTPLASGLLPPEDFVAAYAAAAGRTVDPARAPLLRRAHHRQDDRHHADRASAPSATAARADLRMAIFDHQLPFLYLMLAMTRGCRLRRLAMLLAPEALIDGVVQTLRDAVLPDVGHALRARPALRRGRRAAEPARPVEPSADARRGRGRVRGALRSRAAVERLPRRGRRRRARRASRRRRRRAARAVPALGRRRCARRIVAALDGRDAARRRRARALGVAPRRSRRCATSPC